MGKVRGKTFVVESALMYGAEVWGSCNWLDCMEHCEPIEYSWGWQEYPKTSLQIG